MVVDNPVIATKKALDDAIGEVARFLGMNVPDAPRLIRPEEVASKGLEQKLVYFDGFTNFKKGHICLPEQASVKTLYHEAAHWVLSSNGHNYTSQDNLVYGQIFDEIFATLTQMWMTRSNLPPVRTKQEVSDRLHNARVRKDSLAMAVDVCNKKMREEGRANTSCLQELLANAKNELYRSEIETDSYEFVYWHLCIEENWKDVLANKRNTKEFGEEVLAFHDSMMKKDVHVLVNTIGLLAERGALVHYMFANKPQAIINGWLSWLRNKDLPFSFIYFEFTANFAHSVFEEGKREAWMQQPHYLRR